MSLVSHYIYEVLEGNIILLPSIIFLMKKEYRIEVYQIILDGTLSFLELEFKTDLIMDYLDVDKV